MSKREDRVTRDVGTPREGEAYADDSCRIDDAVETFSEYRPLLISIAYRMLGTVADAEDIVQDTFIRWHRTRQKDIDSTKAFLITIVSRLCLDYLKSARVRREEYVGPWLPEPFPTGSQLIPYISRFLVNAMIRSGFSRDGGVSYLASSSILYQMETIFLCAMIRTLLQR